MITKIKDLLKKISTKKEDSNLENSAQDLFFGQDNSLKNTQWQSDIYKIFDDAIFLQASDIHIEPSEKALKIRFRIDGHFSLYKTLDENSKSSIITKIKVLWSLKIDEHRLPQDWKISYLNKNTNTEIDLRISSMPTIYWEKLAIRLLQKDSNWIDLKSIGILPMNMVKIKKHLMDNCGLILVVWPTWSGKSTTLYSMISNFDANKYNISTLEDPVEYRMRWVNHTQINTSIWFNFADWLRNLLRQDPDIIMVWEIRDSETAKLAVEASITWHLVFSTIHANSSVSIIQRLVHLWIDPLLIVSSLKIVIYQRLARKLCSYCKIKYIPDEITKWKIINRIWKYINNQKEIYLYKANNKWCDKCNFLWYKWRMWLYEILEITESLEKLILSWASNTQLEVNAIWDWLINIKNDALLKVILWEISLEEVFNVLWN